MTQEFEPDPVQHRLQQTRERSVANSRYEFSFAENNDRSIFPIIQQRRDGRPRLIGTGFFVLPFGLFVSAKHVFEGHDIDSEDGFDALVDESGEIHQLPVADVSVSDSTDIAFGVVQLQSAASIVSVMNVDPIVSERGVEVLGAPVFAHTLVQELRPFDSDQVRIQRRYHWEKGFVEEVHPDGCRFVRGRCYSTSIFAEGRSSGAPVFNSCGFVIGLINSGMAPSDGCPNSTVTAISEVLSISVNGTSVQEQRRRLPNNPTVRVRRLSDCG